MKFIVDELPYYEEFCPLYTICWCHDCPRFWDKDKVCSDNNPHECLFLVEASKSMNAGMTLSKIQELYPDAPLAPIIKL
jgi:hypothetical protein